MQDTPRINPLNPPADTYQPDQSSQDDKTVGDLHVKKMSHMAAPVDAKFEWHMKNSDIPNITPKPNQTYLMSFPVICTSADDDSARFRQVAGPTIEDKRVFGAVGPNDSDWDKTTSSGIKGALSGKSSAPKKGIKDALGGK